MSSPEAGAAKPPQAADLEAEDLGAVDLDAEAARAAEGLKDQIEAVRRRIREAREALQKQAERQRGLDDPQD